MNQCRRHQHKIFRLEAGRREGRNDHDYEMLLTAEIASKRGETCVSVAKLN
jgi:hypothetical protein